MRIQVNRWQGNPFALNVELEIETLIVSVGSLHKKLRVSPLCKPGFYGNFPTVGRLSDFCFFYKLADRFE